MTTAKHEVVRRVYGYAYPRNGNAHNTTPRVAWDLFVDGKLVDSFSTRREALAAARALDTR